MEPVAVDLEPLRRSAGLRDILTYERICGIPPHRRFLVILVAVLLFAVAMLTGLWFLGRGDILTVAPILGIFVIGYTVLAAFGFLWWAVGLSRRIKIAAFAWQNGWAYADLLEHTRRPGAAFTRVVHGRERAVIACNDARMPFELGMHHSVSRGQERATIQRPFAFIELPLPASVPHIVLANRKRSIVPTLGLGRGAARMELEGDFAKTFRLIVPEGYQQDALYIFTPDLMARVLDLGSGAEIELVSDRLYVYLPSRTRFAAPRPWRPPSPWPRSSTGASPHAPSCTATTPEASRPEPASRSAFAVSGWEVVGSPSSPWPAPPRCCCSRPASPPSPCSAVTCSVRSSTEPSDARLRAWPGGGARAAAVSFPSRTAARRSGGAADHQLGRKDRRGRRILARET